MAATQFSTWAAKGLDWLDPTEYHWSVRGFFYDTATISGYTSPFDIQFSVQTPGFEGNVESPSTEFSVSLPVVVFDTETPGVQFSVAMPEEDMDE